ncbi:cytochrome P450 [Gordonia soli]|nr:cytochrome P450 [Gordonia soli]
MSSPVDYPFNEAVGLGFSERYRDVRSRPELIRIQMPFGEAAWLATAYEDVRCVLSDSRFSRAIARDHDEPRLRAARRNRGLLSMDAPDHTRVRRLAARTFTRGRVEKLRPAVRDLVAALLDEIDSSRPFDLVDAFALPLPVQVICELLGVPVADRDLFRRWSDAVMSTSSLTAEEFTRSQDEFEDYMRGLIEAKRRTPDDALITGLLREHEENDRLDDTELVDLCTGILVAGHETTATQIPNFVVWLCERPDRWRRIVEDPESVPAVVEELLRIVPLGVGGGSARYAREDVWLGDTLVRAGDAVVTSIAAANRDPDVFAHPDDFDPDRDAQPHVGFGHGAHFCLGASLARMELQEALRGLADRFPDLVIDDVEWKQQMLVRGPLHLTVSRPVAALG